MKKLFEIFYRGEEPKVEPHLIAADDMREVIEALPVMFTTLQINLITRIQEIGTITVARDVIKEQQDLQDLRDREDNRCDTPD